MVNITIRHDQYRRERQFNRSRKLALARDAIAFKTVTQRTAQQQDDHAENAGARRHGYAQTKGSSPQMFLAESQSSAMKNGTLFSTREIRPLCSAVTAVAASRSHLKRQVYRVWPCAGHYRPTEPNKPRHPLSLQNSERGQPQKRMFCVPIKSGPPVRPWLTSSLSKCPTRQGYDHQEKVQFCASERSNYPLISRVQETAAAIFAHPEEGVGPDRKQPQIGKVRYLADPMLRVRGWFDEHGVAGERKADIDTCIP